MTLACECFGRNENCRLCGGSGIIFPEKERVITSKSSSKNFPAPLDSEKKYEVSQWIAQSLADQATLRISHSATEIKAQKAADEAAFHRQLMAKRKAEAARIAADRRQIVAEADARREDAMASTLAEYERLERNRDALAAAIALAESLANQGIFRRAPGADLETTNRRRREKKLQLEAELAKILEAKRTGLLIRKGPYRCNRCSWIHEKAWGSCELCGATTGFTEAV